MALTHPALLDFDTSPRTRLVFGVDTLNRLGELARELGARRALIVTDAGIVAAGHLERACTTLQAANVAWSIYDQVQENPTSHDVETCCAFARAVAPDLWIGLGGGSSLDTAKGANFLLTNGGKMADYRGYGKASHPLLPLIAVPTTAGTGSECQSYAVIADDTTHQKMACGDPKAAARIALLDPRLTLSMPPWVTACTGMDALVHAVETAVTRRRNALSLLYSREAFRLLFAGLPAVIRHPEDLTARSQMLLGAAWAGTAIENSMLGAAHSAANPLTAHFGIVHGQAVGRMLPSVVRFNAALPEVQSTYRDLLLATDGFPRDLSPTEAGESLAQSLEALLRLCQFPDSLAAYGVTEADIPTLAQEAAPQWTAQFNPRPVTVADFEALYRATL